MEYLQIQFTKNLFFNSHYLDLMPIIQACYLRHTYITISYPNYTPPNTLVEKTKMQPNVKYWLPVSSIYAILQIVREAA